MRKVRLSPPRKTLTGWRHQRYFGWRPELQIDVARRHRKRSSVPYGEEPRCSWRVEITVGDVCNCNETYTWRPDVKLKRSSRELVKTAKERRSSESELEKKENNRRMLKTREHVRGKKVVCGLVFIQQKITNSHVNFPIMSRCRAWIWEVSRCGLEFFLIPLETIMFSWQVAISSSSWRDQFGATNHVTAYFFWFCICIPQQAS